MLSDEAAPTLADSAAAMLQAGAAALTLRRPLGALDELARAWSAPSIAAVWRAVHARGDLAAASGAQAVIAGVRGPGVASLRREHPTLRLGASVHDEEEARAALFDGADFLLFGPLWSTPEKRAWLAPRGLGALTRVVALGSPVIAIGGITEPEQVRQARASGAHACAVLRAARDFACLARLVLA